MKFNKIFMSAVLGGLMFSQAFAGNIDRAGSAGATELLVNPWARSVAMGSSNVASAIGLEATYTESGTVTLTKK